MKSNRAVVLAAGLYAWIGLAGCAQTTVSPERESFGPRLPKPGVILVYKFAVNANEVREDQSFLQQAFDGAGTATPDERTAEIANEVAEAMADQLVDKIRELGLPAQHATRDSYVPSDALLITGRFVDIDEGNRTQRLVIGFGAGGSRVDTNVRIYARRNGSGYTTLAEFTVRADSGKMPGAAVTMGAGAAAQGTVTAGMAVANVAATGVKAYRSEIANMATRSADKAVEYLSDIFARQGWIAPH